MKPILLSLALTCAASAAHAELTICNPGGAAQTVGLAYKTGQDWFSEGWWTLPPAECKVLVGGDLANRYYYYTIKEPSGFAGEGFSFCAKDESYELTGVDGDCGAIGANSRLYAQMDTGETAKSHGFDLPALPAPKADGAAPKVGEAPPAPAPLSALVLPVQATTDFFTQGQQGEPFTITARVQGCDEAEGFSGCFVYADGWRWAFDSSAGNNPAAMAELARMPVNTMVEIVGDVIAYNDITVDALVSRISLVAPDAYSAVLDQMQGAWVSTDDAQFTIMVYGSEQFDTYSGEAVSTSVIRFSDAGCPDGSGEGAPVMVLSQMGTPPEEALCYSVPEFSGDTMTYFYLGRGNILSFKRP